MAFITYNQNEIIFLSLFFGILLITFIFILSYPDNHLIKIHQADIEKDLSVKKDKKIVKKRKVAKVPVKKSKNVLETKF